MMSAKDDGFSSESLLEKIKKIKKTESDLRFPFLKENFTDAISEMEGNISRKIETCLDTIGDTTEAICSYISNPYSENLGEKYLYLYGVLQSAIVLSDAVLHLSEALKYPYNHPLEIKNIRKIRNHCIGHPTKKRIGENEHTFNQTTRTTLTNL